MNKLIYGRVRHSVRRSRAKVGRKEKACTDLGIVSETHVLPEVTSEKDLLARSNVKINGAEVVVLGGGNIVGKPMAAMLMQNTVRAAEKAA